MSTRIRSIKPEILEDAATAGLTDAAFRLFVSAITLSDDYGYFRAEPALLHSKVWWKAKATKGIEATISELEPLIEWYEVSGQKYGHIRNWSKHQNVQKPGKQRIPVPCKVGNTPPGSLQRSSRESPETLETDQGSGIRDQGPRNMDHGPPPRAVGGGEGLREICLGNAVNRNGLLPDPEPEEAPEVPREQEYQRAYEAGIEKAKGKGFAMPDKQRGELHQAIGKFAKWGQGQDQHPPGTAIRGADLLEWVEAAAEDFGLWLISKAEADAKAVDYFSSFGPRGMLRWLNAEAMRVEARRVG